jgi:hypothetical protein
LLLNNLQRQKKNGFVKGDNEIEENLVSQAGITGTSVCETPLEAQCRSHLLWKIPIGDFSKHGLLFSRIQEPEKLQESNNSSMGVLTEVETTRENPQNKDSLDIK